MRWRPAWRPRLSSEVGGKPIKWHLIEEYILNYTQSRAPPAWNQSVGGTWVKSHWNIHIKYIRPYSASLGAVGKPPQHKRDKYFPWQLTSWSAEMLCECRVYWNTMSNNCVHVCVESVQWRRDFQNNSGEGLCSSFLTLPLRNQNLSTTVVTSGFSSVTLEDSLWTSSSCFTHFLGEDVTLVIFKAPLICIFSALASRLWGWQCRPVEPPFWFQTEKMRLMIFCTGIRGPLKMNP